MTKKGYFFMDTSGMDKITKKMSELNTTDNVEISELFDEALYDKFIAYFNITEVEDAELISEEEKDRFAIDNTEYGSFQELVDAKGKEYLINKINKSFK